MLVGGAKFGTLRYWGPVHLPGGEGLDYCGVELEEPLGKHDGSLEGRTVQ